MSALKTLELNETQIQGYSLMKTMIIGQWFMLLNSLHTHEHGKRDGDNDGDDSDGSDSSSSDDEQQPDKEKDDGD